MSGDAARTLRSKDRRTGKFVAIIADNGFWPTIEPNQMIKLAGLAQILRLMYPRQALGTHA